jgi:molybdopterin-guanine dinucleotide biosynthesis protein A
LVIVILYGRAVPRASGLLLTGGRSRRLGVDKAALAVDGVPLAVTMADRLAGVCDPVLEVGPGASGRSCVVEEPPFQGPLAALAAGARALTRLGIEAPVLLLAVDLPRVDLPLLTLLRDWPGAGAAVPDAGGRLQPVCARYGPDDLEAAASLVDGGMRALRDLLDVIDVDVVPEAAWRAVAPDDAFADLDTPEDAARLGIDLRRLP